MKRLVRSIMIPASTLLLLTSQSFAQSLPSSTETQVALEKSRAAAKELLSSVRTLLMKQLAAGGAVRAIHVCADSAQAVGTRIQEQHGLTVRRVSEKWRNPKDKPDSYESAQLKIFADLHAKKNLTDTLEVYGLVKEDTVRVFRYMRPIFVGEMCLSCHGGRENMKDLIYSAIQQRYPNDKAMDYTAGDLRGAVSVKIRLK